MCQILTSVQVGKEAVDECCALGVAAPLIRVVLEQLFVLELLGGLHRSEEGSTTSTERSGGLPGKAIRAQDARLGLLSGACP